MNKILNDMQKNDLEWVLQNPIAVKKKKEKSF